jgi:mRNA interferase RelE/StbE
MHDLAASEGVSMSTIARDLIREAIDLREDAALAAFADTRMKIFDRKAALSHESVWEWSMPFTLHYHPAVRVEDFPLIDRRTKDRIRKAIEERLQTAPHNYAVPLRKTLKGYWKLRVGDYRVVFKVIESVWILGIRHRKMVYMNIGERM